MSCQISRSEFNRRIELLRSKGRSHCRSIDTKTKVYHRLPRELFYEGRLIEGSVKVPNVRNPVQSVTLGIEGYDEIDALIFFPTENDCERAFLGQSYGVVFWTFEFLASLNYSYSVNKSTEMYTYCLQVVHSPYEHNYSHGDIRSMINCVVTKWESKVAKQALRELMTREISDNGQIAASPGQFILRAC